MLHVECWILHLSFSEKDIFATMMVPHRICRLALLLALLLSGSLGFCPLSIILNSKASTDMSSRGPIAPASKTSGCPTTSRQPFTDRVHQLIEYRNQYGDTLVPKRYAENPVLGNWVNKQRQQYKKFHAKEKPCSLTDERIRVLNEVGFCWDGTAALNSISSAKRRTESKSWWKRFEELQSYASAVDELPPSLNHWLRQQRQEYQKFRHGEACKLDEKKVKLLNDLDPEWWKTIRQRQWDDRWRELIAYRDRHGDCCVPISYENRKLANWVSNVRKSYNLKRAKKMSKLTNDEIAQLNEIGFVWNRWDYEYQKQLQKDPSIRRSTTREGLAL
jgi:hypothetical protein